MRLYQWTILALCTLLAPAGAAESTRLAAGGKPLLAVITAERPTERVRKAARTLADYIGRMSGAKFEVTTGDGRTGIAVGLPAHFPGLTALDAKDPFKTENYLLRSHARGVHVLGASELAVEHAVWDLLYRLGHRQFFPGETWEAVPPPADLTVTVDAKEHPAYQSRRIWPGFGLWDVNKAAVADWQAKNRGGGGIALNTGHAYDGILNRNKAAFAAHPEYLGLLGGERKSSKFCISNPGLRKLVVEDALAQLRKNPAAQSVSVDPSDGGGWCECPKCRALGSVSDRALTLANEVARAVNVKHPGTLVGMYAYSEHSPPPSITVHPRVVISVATAFVRGGYSVDDLLAGWRKKEATLGIREYYSVATWDRDLPGRARGANPGYLQKTIPHFHEKGGRFLSAESSDNWGPNGLGYYLAARMMWDVREAKRVDALIDDFLTRAFGTAREPMAEFYRLIDGRNRPLLSSDLIGRMYRCLADAQKKTEDDRVRARLGDLTLYTRYVELYFTYSHAAGEARQAAFEALIRHGYRMRGTRMVHSLALYRDLAGRDKSVRVPKEAAWNAPEGKNPWKSSAPFSREELGRIVAAGVVANKVLDFRPVSFSTDLVPASKLRLPAVKAGSMGLYSRGTRDTFTWVADAPASVKLRVKAGIVYANRGEAKLALYPAAETEGKAVARAGVVPDREEHPVELKTTFTGLHRLEVTDAGAGTAVTWPDGLAATVMSSPDAPAAFHGRWTLYFYVPKGTKVVGGYSSGVGTLLDGGGKVVHTFGKEAGYFSVPVAAGQDGKLWLFRQCTGQRLLMTVPPYLARSGDELLLPAEVVKKDAER